MQATVIISLFGDDKKLITLRRIHEKRHVTAGTVRTRIIFHGIVSAEVDLMLESSSLDGSAGVLKNTCKLQIEDVLTQLGMDNFQDFVEAVEARGWTTERYVDSIQDYFCVDHWGNPKSVRSMALANVAIGLLALIVIASPTIALFFLSEPTSLYTGFTLFAIFIAVIGCITVSLPIFPKARQS